MANPTLVSVDVKSSVLIRLNFSEEMILNSDLIDPNNYTVEPITPGAAPVFFTEVITPEDDDFPIWVELPLSEMTDGDTYEVTVSATGPVNRTFETMDSANNSTQYTGKGVFPSIDRAESVGANRADIIFTELMEDNASIRDETKYTWDNGLTTLSVLDVVGDIVKLVTSEQTEGILYTLTIANV